MHSGSDEVIRQARAKCKEQVAARAERAAEKISRLLPTGITTRLAGPGYRITQELAAP